MILLGSLMILALATACTGEDITCDQSGSYLAPYPEDCSKYISCENSKGTLEECEPGFYFDSKSLACVSPDDAFCYEESTGAPSTTTDSTDTTGSDTTTDSDTTVSTSTTSHPTGDPTSCDEDGSYLQPYPDDCTKYISCSDGKGEIEDCDPGFYFDTVTLSCTSPDDAYCYGDPTPEPTTTTTQTTQTTSNETTLSPPTTLTPPTGDPFNCENGDNYLRPYPGDCTKYIECDHDTPLTEDCPPGLWFDKNLLVCVLPADADCDYARRIPHRFRSVTESMPLVV